MTRIKRSNFAIPGPVPVPKSLSSSVNIENLRRFVPDKDDINRIHSGLNKLSVDVIGVCDKRWESASNCVFITLRRHFVSGTSIKGCLAGKEFALCVSKCLWGVADEWGPTIELTRALRRADHLSSLDRKEPRLCQSRMIWQGGHFVFEKFYISCRIFRELGVGN